MAVGGGAYLALAANALAAGLAVFTCASYLLLYTPLKKRSTTCTTIGAIPGAMPPLIGWAAAAGELSLGAWILYAILFLWQFPHFMAIAWLYREDYGRAGIRMLPVVEPEGTGTARQVVGSSALLVPVTLLPVAAGLAGGWYLAGALLLGLGFLYFGLRLANRRTLPEARRLLHASVIYLPLLYAALLLDRR
jgi:heme o synthase